MNALNKLMELMEKMADARSVFYENILSNPLIQAELKANQLFYDKTKHAINRLYFDSDLKNGVSFVPGEVAYLVDGDTFIDNHTGVHNDDIVPIILARMKNNPCPCRYCIESQ